MLIDIPITRQEQQHGSESQCSEFHGLKSVWDGKRELGLQPAPLDYWGRHKKYFDVHALQKQFSIPAAVQAGHGDMHLDDWLEPDQFVRHAVRDGIFEMKLSVSDFKPHELKLTLNDQTRLVSIEGRHDHRAITRASSVHAHFNRSFTLPMAVLERRIECKLSPDGHHLILTAPVAMAMAPHRRLCSKSESCANFFKCDCTTDEQTRG